MKILLFLIFTLGNSSSDACSTFYLIRHAEKIRIDSSDRDPDLNQKGVVRAEKWKDYFLDKNISKIYSTNYKRTLNTIKPIAQEINFDAIIYSPSKIEFKSFIESNIGNNILIVGHSNTIPDFVNRLINNNIYSQIDDSNNSNLYIVSICKSEINHRLIKVN